MNEIQVFNYKGQDVRTVEIDGNTWWVLIDVCRVLNLSTPKQVAKRLDEDEVSQTHVIDRVGRLQKATIINESGLYSVILRSDKPEAKAFRRWVTHTVLPTIRQTGHFDISEPSVETGLQRVGLIIRAAEHKAVPQSEQLRLLSIAVRDLTGTELNYSASQKCQALNLMDLPEVFGVLKKGKIKKFGKSKIQLFSLLEIADMLGLTPSEFNDFADEHKLKSQYNGEWVRVETPQGEAREFVYIRSIISDYRKEVR